MSAAYLHKTLFVADKQGDMQNVYRSRQRDEKASTLAEKARWVCVSTDARETHATVRFSFIVKAYASPLKTMLLMELRTLEADDAAFV